jgi:hypothetical protein
MRGPLLRAVEEITGCRIDASMSATHVNPDFAAEMLVVDRMMASLVEMSPIEARRGRAEWAIGPAPGPSALCERRLSASP